MPLRAERVRVVVAVGVPGTATAAMSGLTALRALVIESLTTANHVERWGGGPVFSAEIEREDLDQLARDPRVRAVDIDDGGTAALLESVPLIGGDLVSSQGWDGDGITVAVVDSGVDSTHPDLAGRIVGEQCYCENRDGSGCCPNGAKTQSGSGAAADDYGHGTHVAGIIAGRGAVAPRGVAPAVKIVAVKVLNREGDLRSFTQLFHALEWIHEHHPQVRVINMSLGSNTLYQTEGQCNATAVGLGLATIVAQLRERGVLSVASSGNQGSTSATALPACMSEVLGVGATYDAPGSYTQLCSAVNAVADQVACFTNSNPTLDFLAPGAPILSSWPAAGKKTGYGTSLAAPHVAGVIALMQQVARGRLDADEAVSILRTTGRPVLDARNGLTLPRIDAAAAVAATPRAPAPARRRSVRR